MLIHIRYDEIALKGKKRSWYEKRLRRNLARSLDVERGQVERTPGRLLVHLAEDHDLREALRAIQRTFGVASASVVQRVEKDFAALEPVALDLARRGQAEGHRTFKVQTRRADKSFPLTSYELSASLGAKVLDAVPELTVDVHEPDLVIQVEVRGEGIYVHTERVPGPGGMPVGTAGQALVLLSGGIDSPVAAWLTLKRGLHTDCVYYHAFPYTGDKVLEKVLTIARRLAVWTPRALKVYVPSTTAIQDAIQAGAPEGLRIVLLRRSMYRIARLLQQTGGYQALATGEALGQVASQTPENLLCVEAAVPDVLVLRPLIGFDKHEIISRAQAIDTYETSILPYQDCCSLFAPRQPATHATIAECEDAEEGLDLEGLELASLEAVEVYVSDRGLPFEKREEPAEPQDA